MRLQIPLEETTDLRVAFAEEYKKTLGVTYDNRVLFEKWTPQIGANGVIAVLNEVSPSCHDEAHDFGKVIYATTQDMAASLQTCEDVCESGCMHGVLMEAFAIEGQDHVDSEDIATRVEELCENPKNLTDLYLTGDCYHGAGHALMYLADYDIEAAITSCDAMSSYAAKYYCATGAYMEYNNVKGKENVLKHKPVFYPCDTSPYPAACFRYKMVSVVSQTYIQKKPFTDLVKVCSALDGKYQLGCFHGIGNANMPFVAKDQVDIARVCRFGSKEDQQACIDGVMDRLEKYYPEKAAVACDVLKGWQKDYCEEAYDRKIYNMERDFSLYQR
jgi:hypothetical protein